MNSFVSTLLFVFRFVSFHLPSNFVRILDDLIFVKYSEELE